ncbi:holo-[acyl-carrier-protein] synthase [Candidatus Aerophobetes bacterium]|uniref:Holo-[acyl-carrier-protein] synthase n=1 Tax=Aerophobetes bacterium TaxID=2030807 RepID=A0A523T9I8_UNCAE|nr:MAG: holo-[acyl-carrier-protein] synthase [Candidatus Aerophobetes bacterium]
MIKGIGIDIVEVKRLRDIIQRWGERAKKRMFTSKELKYAHMRKKGEFIHLAGRFAAKEAVVKSLGQPTSFLEVEISKEKNGRPYITLKGRTKETAREKGVKEILVTLSHTRTYAVAQAVALGEK